MRSDEKTLMGKEGASGEQVGGGRPASSGAARGDGGARRAAWIVAGFLALFTPLNVYWGFGGKWGVAWVIGGCDDCIPLAREPLAGEAPWSGSRRRG